MKILMLTPYLPYPLLSGGQTRSYNLLKYLGRKHEITLFSLIKDESERKFIKELSKFCKKILVFKRSKKPWTLRNILLTGFSFYPFLVIRNLSGMEKEAVKNELKQNKYDLIHAETFYVMPHIPSTSVPILLVEQTIEYLVYRHYVEEQAHLFLRPLLKIDVAKIKFWETHFWQRANKVVAMSQADKQIMQNLSPGLVVDIVPNGVDTEYFSVKKESNPNQKILYVGNFKWLQNTEAVELLVNEIWPKIQDRLPKAKLWIVGMGMTEGIKNLASSNIEVSEGMPDIRVAYNNASVLVAPIKSPGGTRLKILEAMASGVPVVTTKIGMEGLEAKDGYHAFIKETTDEMVKSTIDLLKDRRLAHKLAANARKLVEEKYSWQVSAQNLDFLYYKVASHEKKN